MDHLSDKSPNLAEFQARLDAFLKANLSAEHIAGWQRQGHVDRSFWRAFGEAGLLCVSLPQSLGGAGGNFRHEAALISALVRHGATGFAAPLHSAVVAPYIARYAREQQRQAWMPQIVSGEMPLAIAMTEPGAGSDLQAIRTQAVREGDNYRINGQKTFISNALVADLVIVACKTDAASGAKGISLIAVETKSKGFERGRLFDKLGQSARDTSELFLRDVLVPVDNLLGEEGRGFAMLMQNLPQERVVIACQALAMSQHALSITLGSIRPELDKRGQARVFRLAECATEIEIARVFVDNCIERLISGTLDTATASMAKYWVSEMQARIIETCMETIGLSAVTNNHPLGEMYRDARAFRIYGGTTEIMKAIIARSL